MHPLLQCTLPLAFLARKTATVHHTLQSCHSSCRQRSPTHSATSAVSTTRASHARATPVSLWSPDSGCVHQACSMTHQAPALGSWGLVLLLLRRSQQHAGEQALVTHRIYYLKHSTALVAHERSKCPFHISLVSTQVHIDPVCSRHTVPAPRPSTHHCCHQLGYEYLGAAWEACPVHSCSKQAATHITDQSQPSSASAAAARNGSSEQSLPPLKFM